MSGAAMALVDRDAVDRDMLDKAITLARTVVTRFRHLAEPIPLSGPETRLLAQAVLLLTQQSSPLHEQVERVVGNDDPIDGSPDAHPFPSVANTKQVGGDHYATGMLQHWDLVAMFQWDYFQGQITKYLMRWRKKNGVQDLEKAAHFLEKYIEVAKKEDTNARVS